MSAALLHSVFAAKPLDHVDRTILGCDLSVLRSAPFGNLVRIAFDVEYDGAGRQAALDCSKVFLPSCIGFRHFVIAQGDGSFIVGLCPEQDRDDDIIVSELRASGFAFGHSCLHRMRRNGDDRMGGRNSSTARVA